MIGDLSTDPPPHPQNMRQVQGKHLTPPELISGSRCAGDNRHRTAWDRWVRTMAIPPSMAAEAISEPQRIAARPETPLRLERRRQASRAGRWPPASPADRAPPDTRRCSRSPWRRRRMRWPAQDLSACRAKSPSQKKFTSSRRQQAPQQVAGIRLLRDGRRLGQEREKSPGDTGDGHQGGAQRIGRADTRQDEIENAEQRPGQARPRQARESFAFVRRRCRTW